MFQNIINFLNFHTPIFYWTQSLWRDEAFSVWIAQDSFGEIIKRTSGDFNPPLYYILLHYWMKLFGRSELMLRSLSLLFFIMFLVVIFKFAKKILKSNKAAYITLIIAALNPMLLYFAFELRMYSLLILFATLSMYFFYLNNWPMYIISTILGLYTQPFMIFILLVQNVCLFITKKLKVAVLISLAIFILYLPWIPTLLGQFKQSGPMWMYPVDATLLLSVFGNLFLGYEGTPGGFWHLMIFASFIIVAISLSLWRIKKMRKTLLLFYLWLALPTFVILAISLFKPIYVHRYLIYVTVAEVFLLSFFIVNINSLRLRSFFTWGTIFLLVIANFWAVDFHRKLPIRDAFKLINKLLTENDVVYAQTPLIYYESLYYSSQTAIYLYNPQNITPPRFVGSIGMPPSIWVKTYPQAPQRAFVVKEDGTFFIASVLNKP